MSLFRIIFVMFMLLHTIFCTFVYYIKHICVSNWIVSKRFILFLRVVENTLSNNWIPKAIKLLCLNYLPFMFDSTICY